MVQTSYMSTITSTAVIHKLVLQISHKKIIMVNSTYYDIIEELGVTKKTYHKILITYFQHLNVCI